MTKPLTAAQMPTYLAYNVTHLPILCLAPKQIPSSKIVSKCSILQDSSQIYDPLGWATPVTVQAKILL